MTIREAIRRLRVRTEPVSGAWWGDEFGTDAIKTLVRALSRPTRLEREARDLIDNAEFICEGQRQWARRWLRAFERKRKGKR